MKKYNWYQILAIIWTIANCAIATGYFMGFICEHCGTVSTILYGFITWVSFTAYYDALIVRKKNNTYNEKG